jgi:hypothetical protein
VIHTTTAAAPHTDGSGFGDVWVSVLILFGILLLAYVLMWRGWKRRAGRHGLPPLAEAAPETEHATLESDGRYFGTTVAGDWLDRVVARGLGSRSVCTLRLTSGGVDVIRPGGRSGSSFRIPLQALRGARHDQGIAGKVVPPHGLVVLTWQHGDTELDSGFRLDGATDSHNAWVDQVTTIVKENAQ